MILVDTSVWIDLFRGTHTPEKRRLDKALNDRDLVVITDVILTEILRGVTADAEFRRVQRQLESFPRLPARSPQTFVRAAQLYRRCRRKGATIASTIDCLIAAICIENGATLLHRDSDFESLARHTPLKTLRCPAA